MDEEGYFDNNILNGSELGDRGVGKWLWQLKAEEKEEQDKNFWDLDGVLGGWYYRFSMVVVVKGNCLFR